MSFEKNTQLKNLWVWLLQPVVELDKVFYSDFTK